MDSSNSIDEARDEDVDANGNIDCNIESTLASLLVNDKIVATGDDKHDNVLFADPVIMHAIGASRSCSNPRISCLLVRATLVE